jgi:hypothetical protein
MSDLMAAKAQTLATGRYRRIEFSESTEELAGQTCRAYAATSEDRGVPEFPGSIFILKEQGYYCTPLRTDSLFHFIYSERFPKGEERLPTFPQEAQDFFRSVEFAYN